MARTSQNISIQGLNQETNVVVVLSNCIILQMEKNLFQQNIGTNTKVTISFDWKATNPTSGSFQTQYNDIPWNNAYINKTRINVTPTNSSGHVEVTFPSSDVENMSSAVASGIELRLDNVPTIQRLQFQILNMKLANLNTLGRTQINLKQLAKIHPNTHRN